MIPSHDPDPGTKPDQTADDPDGAAQDDPSIAQSFRDWLRGLTRRNGAPSDRENVAEVLGEELATGDHLAPMERLMLLNILKLGDTRVGDVMVPRADILGVDASASLDELIDVLREGFHSRVPVFKETLDDIIGFIHIKDVLEFWGGSGEFVLSRAAREILFVPSSMRVVDLLLKMRLARVHIGIVVDEYGGTDGLVTIEDLVEEIVGEIEDEHEDARGPMFTVHPDGSIVADGRASVEELESRLGVDLLPDAREEDIESVGGLLVSLVGRVPMRGELISHPTGLEFEIMEADPRRVKQVRIAGLAGVGPQSANAPATSGEPSDQ
jgi:CBS domain containing-hemolysin-like protein